MAKNALRGRINGKILAGLKAGESVAVPSNRPSTDMRVAEVFKSQGMGYFRQRKVLILDERRRQVSTAVLIECIVPMPKKIKKPRKVRKGKGQKHEPKKANPIDKLDPLDGFN